MKSHSPAILKLLLAGSLSLSTLPSVSAQTHHKAAPTDYQILAKVQKVFHDEPAFAGMSILPAVNHGVVTLSGAVTNDAAKVLASSELANIDGVKTVLNNLTIVTYSHPAPPPPVQVLPSGPKVVTLPAGTTVPIRISDEIDTKTAKANDTFHGTTASSIGVAGYTLIPTGTTVTGRVIDAKAASHFSGSADLSIELVSVRLPGPSGSQDVSVVTEQLSNKATGRGANTAEKAGGGAAFGAIVGALAGGGAGAGIGAASGGALGLGANAITRGKQIDIKPEQLLQFRTASPLAVTIMLQNGKQVTPQPAPAPALQTRSVDPAAPGF